MSAGSAQPHPPAAPPDPPLCGRVTSNKMWGFAELSVRICWSGITRGRVSKSTLQMDHIGDLAIKQSAVNSLRTGRPGPYAGWGGLRGSIVKFSPSLMRAHAYNNYMRKFSPPCCMKIGIGLCYICDLPLYGRQFPMQRSPLYDRRFPPPPPKQVSLPKFTV